ncbi:hypothetical protein LTR05_006649 [Lithohypha guttulata]|uniref:Cytochrome P450 n=1 Tax=Lithohypha guttulata TaxID=1690604 RepID=A0AAN7SVK4_9EURO|nr:hypothetical protein LTR05_006649 [Lithohypha guttulata]
MTSNPVSSILENVSPRTAAAVLVLLTIVFRIVSYVSSYRRLSHIPGPPLAAWTNLWWVRAATSRKGHLYLYEALEKYGPLVRIAPNILVTSDTDLVRKVNAVRSPYRKSDWYKAFRFDADRENAFSETNKDNHARLKSKLTPGYSGKENPNLEPDMDKVILTFVDLIKSKYVSKTGSLKPVDIGQKIQFLTLDIITCLASGRPFGWLEDEDKYEYIATMEANFPAMNFMSAVPVLSRLMRAPAFQRMTLPTVKDRVGMGKVKAVAHEIIAKRFEENKTQKQPRNDMLQSMINHGLNEGEIADDSLLQILAGSDTSGTILRSALIFTIANPRVYHRLQAEVTSAGVPSDQVISHARAQELPYLNAVIKETLRYYPVNTGLNPKVVGPEGDIYNGLHIPPGTEIGYSAWALYRHNPLYGADCAHFRPDRWIEADPDLLARMEREHELVFLTGRYKCLGERIARIELLKCLFEMMRRFDFSFMDPLRPLQKEDNYGLWIQRGLWVRVEELEVK